MDIEGRLHSEQRRSHKAMMTPVLRTTRLATVLLLAIDCTLQAQTYTGPQSLAFAGLRSVANQGQFNAVKTDPSGNLFLLLDQGDGVRILKTDPTATTLLAQSQLGAAGDIGLSLALDPSGNVYVAGTTTSTTLAGTPGTAFPNRADTSTNSFIAKYDPNLNNLFVTFAGSGRLAATSVAATADAVFLTGSLFAATLPVTSNGFQQTPAPGGSQYGFVERFSANGSTLVYATYLTGANGDTSPAALAADSSDAAYIAGYTTATGFPTLNALSPIIQSSASGFLTKLTPAGDALTFSTFIPGSGVTSLALDPAQNNLLLSGNIALGAFPIATVQSPLVATTYQSALRLPLNGSSVLTSTLLAPGTQSSVTPAPNGLAWADGPLTTPLLPLTPVANIGTSFATRITATGTIDQTARFGGLAGANPANASAPVTLTSLATDLSGQPFLAGAFNPTASSSLLATQRYDLPLTTPSTALPSAVQDAALPASACTNSSSCVGSAAYLAKLTTASPTASLALSTGASPDILLRNLSTTAATNLQLTATGFTLASTCPTTLPAGAECSIALTGSGPGTLTAQADNAPTQTASLPASSTSPTAIVFSPRELDFGIQTLASAPTTRTITVTNLGPTAQTFTSAFEGASGRNAPTPLFTESSSDCTSGTLATSKVLPAGATCHITLTFAITSATPDGPIQNYWKIATSGSRDVTLTAYANAAALSLSSSAIDFGTQYPSGLRTARYLYLSNNSDTAISHTPATLGSGPFVATDRCPTSLAPHTVCQIQFAYESPTSPSNDATTLNLDQGLSVQISGHTLPNPNGGSTTVNPTLTVTPTTITFPNAIPVTTQSGTQTVTINNTGAAPFALNLALTGDFSDTTNCPVTLPAAQSCSVVLTFAPTAPGTRTGLLSVTAGSGTTPLYVNLTGTATPILPTNNGSFDFGSSYVTQPSVLWMKVAQSFQSLTAAATGPFSTVLMEDIGYGHGNPAPSAFQSTTSGTCINCFLGVQFKPTTPGPQTGPLTLTSGTNTNAYTLALTGSGLPLTGLIVTPATQDFGSVPVNSTSQPYLLTLTNLLTTPQTITLSAPATTGDFALSQAPTGGATCTGTLAPNATCYTQVVFSPAATGSRTGTLTFQTSSGTATASLTGTATADPGLSLSPTALTFQNVPGLTATQQTITLTNTGTASSQIATPTATAPNFAASTTCSTLAPTAACTITVTYTATTAQTTAALQIPTGAQTYTVPLTGAYTTQNAGLQILPAQVNFGPTPVDVTGPTRTLTINNLTANLVTLALTLPRQFALVTANPCPTLAANATCTFDVTALPLTTADTTGTIFAQATGGGSTINGIAYLETFGTTPSTATNLRINGNLSPGTGILDFGQVTSGQSATQTLTLTNSSTNQQTLTLRRVTSQLPFLSTTTCGATLAPAQFCTVTVTYSPLNQVATGTPSGPATQNTGILTLESDDPASPTLINLTGSAAPVTVASPSNSSPVATYTLTQSSLTFPNTSVGNVSPTQTVTLTNTGTTTLHLGTLRTTADFTLSTNCPQNIFAAATCTLSIAFTPTTNGILTSTAQIASDSGTSLDFITLLGTSFPSSLLVTPQSLSFSSLPVGSTSPTQAVTLTNNGQTPVTLSTIAATGDYTTSNICPASLAVNATCTVQVAFTPTAAGTRTGTLSITNSATTLPLVSTLTSTGLQSHLLISPATLAFGNAGVGSGLNLSLVLSNNGTAPITALALAITGDYVIATPCSTATLAPSQTCTVTITFTPAATGTRSGALTITSSDATSPATVSLTGTGIQSRLQITPTTLTFPNTPLGASSTLPVTLTNIGTAQITSLAPAISGDFTIATPCPTATLPPGQSCTLTLTFTPTGSGTRTGALTLTSSDPASPATVPLTGTGTQSRLQVTPATLAFGNLLVGTTTTLPITITNSGTAPVTAVTLFIAGDYAVTALCPSATLAPGASCSTSIAFTPTATGLRNGTFTVTSSDPTSPATVPLTGTGIQPHLQATPATESFPTTTIGVTTTLPLTLANIGSAPLTGITLTITGDYAIASPCALATLAPGQSCSVTLSFNPTATGTRPGTLTIRSSDPASPTAIPLTGTGTAAAAIPGTFTLTVNGAQTATSTVPSGSTATYSLTVTPLNGFTGPIVLNCTPVTSAPYSSCAMLPSTLTLAGSPQNATLTITTLTALNGAKASLTPIATRTLLAVLAPACFLFLHRKRRRALPLLFAWTALYAFALTSTGCGGRPNPNLLYVNPGTYQYQVTASSIATVPITQSVNVTVVVTN